MLTILWISSDTFENLHQAKLKLSFFLSRAYRPHGHHWPLLKNEEICRQALNARDPTMGKNTLGIVMRATVPQWGLRLVGRSFDPHGPSNHSLFPSNSLAILSRRQERGKRLQ
jgi:hypothetical protein